MIFFWNVLSILISEHTFSNEYFSVNFRIIFNVYYIIYSAPVKINTKLLYHNILDLST